MHICIHLQTDEEFKKYYLSEIAVADMQKTAELHIASKDEPMVATVDWRTQGVVTPVGDQVRKLIS